MAGNPGWTVKMWGVLILALTWFLIFMMLISAGISSGNGSSSGLGDFIFKIYSVFTAFSLAHFLGFSLIALGWSMENSETATKIEVKNTFDKRRKLVIETPESENLAGTVGEKGMPPYYQINQEEDLVVNLPPPRK